MHTCKPMFAYYVVLSSQRSVVQIGSLGRKESCVIAGSNCFLNLFYRLFLCLVSPFKVNAVAVFMRISSAKFFTPCDLGYTIALAVLQVFQLLQLKCHHLVWSKPPICNAHDMHRVHLAPCTITKTITQTITKTITRTKRFAMLVLCMGLTWQSILLVVLPYICCGHQDCSLIVFAHVFACLVIFANVHLLLKQLQCSQHIEIQV